MQTTARILHKSAATIWMQLNFGKCVGVVFAPTFDGVSLAVLTVSLFLRAAARLSGVFPPSVVTFFADTACQITAPLTSDQRDERLKFKCSPASFLSEGYDT
ncbi:uncharacterized protein PHACADRAFT_260815 [Phanerochaete carnosa HHB-10118-sp]|uniref:Uncharacterized protein n=1 Tax=Phanerochaete carnosa (strain HHB-10118-sp) TaxID=650164 RepID=K5WQ14_PHACS|nr:uncharacterized protein PHACADRAFT_260815 [Phanerochaete carnosa HHB-10118-sp]EKM52432.1 hypothetical protein PHACADRAFT_260815 [Phanerochaete carnosa HHB-10118-sp]